MSKLPNKVISRVLKDGLLRRFPHPSSLRRTAEYASFLRISGALHLTIFEQPEKDGFFSSLLVIRSLSNSVIRSFNDSVTLDLVTNLFDPTYKFIEIIPRRFKSIDGNLWIWIS